MRHTEVVDWRVWKAAQVAADGPPVYPGGDPVKAGDHVYVITNLEKSAIGDVSFVTPSPVALALNVAISGANAAERLRRTLKPLPTKQPSQSRWLGVPRLADLYGYFEQCMITATFSYQAVEAFANQIVIEGLSGTIRLQRRDGPVDLNAQEVERRCSTEEKVGTVLPYVTGIASPKGTRLWENLATLKDIRDATIHLKSKDQYVRGRPDNQTLYFQLLNIEPKTLPTWAIAAIRYFSAPQSLAWIGGAEALL